MKRTLFVLLLLTSCRKEQPAVNITTMLVGPWDAYYGILQGNIQEGLQYAVLFNYEHGFEIYQNGTYRSRYANGTTFAEGFHTSTNEGSWKIKGDTLTFYHTFQGVTENLYYKIINLDQQQLKIELIGVDNSFAGNFQRTYYLKRAKV